MRHSVTQGRRSGNNRILISTMLQEMLNAGTETSATFVESAVAELAIRSDLIKQAQNEVDDVVGLHHLLQESDLPNLPFLQANYFEKLQLCN